MQSGCFNWNLLFDPVPELYRFNGYRMTIAAVGEWCTLQSKAPPQWFDGRRRRRFDSTFRADHSHQQDC
jgi:hypothetical protein